MYSLVTGNFFRQPPLLDRLFRDLDPSLEGQGFVPAVDFSEDEKSLRLSFDLPGMKREDFSVEVRDGMLTVEGKRESLQQNEVGFSEKCYGNFRRSFALPKSADSEAVTAKFEDGVLDVVVAKRQEALAKRIEIA